MSKELKFKSWNHPTTNQHRVYIDGLPDKGESKVWVEATPEGSGFEVKVRLAEGVTSGADELKLAAEAALNDVKTFDEVVALVV